MSTADVLSAPIRSRPGTPAPKADEGPGPAVQAGFVINPPQTGKSKYQFRLMAGMYVDYNGESTPTNKAGRRIYQINKKANVYPVIETDEDLTKFNGKAHGMSEKFTRISFDRDVVVQYTDPTVRLAGESVATYLKRMDEVMSAVKKQTEATLKAIDSLTLEQLTEYAAAEEIDLKGAKTVEQVRKIVKTTLES